MDRKGIKILVIGFAYWVRVEEDEIQIATID